MSVGQKAQATEKAKNNQTAKKVDERNTKKKFIN
jgi:hypothetical protein